MIGPVASAIKLRTIGTRVTVRSAWGVTRGNQAGSRRSEHIQGCTFPTMCRLNNTCPEVRRYVMAFCRRGRADMRFGWVMAVFLMSVTPEVGAVIDDSTPPPPRALYFAHMADGGGYVTQIMLVNPGETDVSVILQLFRSDGTPFETDLSGSIHHIFAYAIRPHATLFLRTAGAGGQVVAGWAKVESTGPIGGSLLYRYHVPGQKPAEAGIDPAQPTTAFMLPVDQRAGIYSGLALANPSDTASAAISLNLYDSSGVQFGSTQHRILAPRRQVALLAGELFADVNLDGFCGTIAVRATSPVAATTVRFNQDVSLLASLPVIALPAADLPAVHPEAVGYSSHRLEEAARFAEQTGYAAIMVLYDGQVLFSWGEVDKNFNCHSIRKPLLSALYGIHVAEGHINLDSSLEQLGIDDIPPGLTVAEKQATIRELLQSRSGVYHEAAGETQEMMDARPPRG
ncbi:MAG: beta-lactamase family protein, partial [Acidobacteria bacterium]|nr:beta-lactamase family protein [Acidobacteriota bacterium]